MKKSETYTISDADPRYYQVEHRISGRTRKYRVNLRTGQVFKVVPDDKKALPICMYQMKMQKSVRDALLKLRTPAAMLAPKIPTEVSK
jgi:hypothetical protein